MALIEAKEKSKNKLGGKSKNSRRGDSANNKNRLRYTPIGYIRSKKVGRGKYYYYCEAVKQQDGSFKEQCEYLGTARAIRNKIKGV